MRLVQVLGTFEVLLSGCLPRARRQVRAVAVRLPVPARVTMLAACVGMLWYGVRATPGPAAAAAGAASPRAQVRVPLMTADVMSLLERNPLKIELERRPPPPPPAPPPAPPPKPVEPPHPPAPVPSPSLKLLGTLAGPGPRLAIIQEPGGKSGVYAIGEKVGPKTVIDITRKRVYLRSGTGQEYLEIRDDGAPPASEPAVAREPEPAPGFVPAVAEPPPQPEAPANGQTISKELPREEVMRNFGNPANFLAQVVAEPYYENSRFSGYFVQEVKAGSYASSLGLQAGDIIETVNGDLIDNIQKAFRLIGTIQRAPEMDIAVRRGTERVHLDFRLQ